MIFKTTAFLNYSNKKTKEEFFLEEYGNEHNEYEELPIIKNVGYFSENVVISENDNEIFKCTPDSPSVKSPVYEIQYYLNNNDYYSEILTSNNKILYYLDSNVKFSHTEFHFTYTNIIPNDDIINFYLAISVKKIEEHFNSLEKIDNIQLKNIDPSYIRTLSSKVQQNQKLYLPNTIDNVISSKVVLYREPTEKNIYLIPNLKASKSNNSIDLSRTILSIDWVIQLTIGVLIEDIVDVINYLGYVDEKQTIIDKNWKNAIINGQYFVNNFVSLYENYNINNEDLKKLMNFIIIVMYELSLMNFLPSSYGGSDKYKYSFGIRHEYHTIFPQINNDLLDKFYYYVIDLMNNKISFEYINLENTNNFQNIKLELINLLFFIINDDESFIRYRDSDGKILKNDNGKPIKIRIQNIINKYPFKDNIILIEIRSFYKHLHKKIEETINVPKINKLTLTQLEKYLEHMHLYPDPTFI